MRKSIHFVFAVALIFFCSNTFSQSTVAVMKCMNGTTKLNGGSTVPNHIGDIDILSYSHGENFCFTCGKTAFADLTVMMTLNATSIPLRKLLINSTKLTSVDLTYIQKGTATVEYHKVHMEDVIVTSFQESGSSERPTVSVSFSPDRIAWQFTTIKSDGTAGTKSSYGWNVAQNAEWLFF